MERVEVLDLRGQVVAVGVVCPCCSRLRAQSAMDVVDIGQGPGLLVCDECVACHDAEAVGRDPGEPMPWELGYEDAANDNGGDCAAE